MASPADSAFNRLLKDLDVLLRPHEFRRVGQRYGRHTDRCWHVIGVQKSRYSDSGEVRFTLNFGVTSKALMEFRGADVSKMPLDWSCPIRCRIGEFMGQDDVWWALKDRTEFQSSFEAISICLSEKAIPFLNGLNTNEGILALYDTGLVMGFGIDLTRHEPSSWRRPGWKIKRPND